MNQLLEDAKRFGVRKAGNKTRFWTKDEVEVFVAYMKRELTESQVHRALKLTGNASNQSCSALRLGIERGWIKLEMIDDSSSPTQ